MTPTQPSSSAPATWAPFRYWWPSVNRATLRLDFIAAITTTVVALPQGVAYALVAGLPPEFGLYSCIVPAIFAAMFGSSHHAVSGPTTPLALLVFATVTPLAEPGSGEYIRITLTLALLAGGFQLALGLARLGAFANLISHSVIVGFTAGAAVLIMGGQLGNALGVPLPNSGILAAIWADPAGIFAQVNGATVLVTATTFLVALVVNHYKPRWPGLLIATVAGSLLAALLNALGAKIALMGSLPTTLPPLTIPDVSPSTVQSVLSPALAIALVGLVEAIGIARSLARETGQRINPNQEFLGQGMSNIMGSFFASFPSTASFARSNINFHAGARTPMAAIMGSILVLILLGIIGPAVAFIPMASVAGVLLLIGIRLLDVAHIRIILRTSRQESAVLILTFLTCVLVALDFAIYVGVIVSLLLYLNRISHPRVSRVVNDESGAAEVSCPHLTIAAVDGSLFFGSVSHVDDGLRELAAERPDQPSLLLLCRSINFIDINGAQFLAEEAARRRQNGGQLYLSGVKSGVLEVLKRSGYLAQIGPENLFGSQREALAVLSARMAAAANGTGSAIGVEPSPRL